MDWIANDCAGNNSSYTVLHCTICDPTDENLFNLQLTGHPTVFLFNGTIKTGLKITFSLNKAVESKYVQLYIECCNTLLGEPPVNLNKISL